MSNYVYNKSFSPHHFQVKYTTANGIFVMASGQIGIIIDSAIIGSQSTQYALNISGGQRGRNDTSVTESMRITQPTDNAISIIKPYSQGIEISSAGQNGAFYSKFSRIWCKILQHGRIRS